MAAMSIVQASLMFFVLRNSSALVEGRTAWLKVLHLTVADLGVERMWKESVRSSLDRTDNDSGRDGGVVGGLVDVECSSYAGLKTFRWLPLSLLLGLEEVCIASLRT